MDRYNPLIAPDPVQWLDTDESERIMLVKEFHIDAGYELEEEPQMLHAAIHVLVENQIALKMEPIPATVKKLIRQGLDRHEAIHAIGAILSEDIFDLMHDKAVSFNAKAYRRRLDKLTAKRWLKGKW